MNIKSFFRPVQYAAFAGVVMLGASGCQPDEADKGNGLTTGTLDASFVVSGVDGSTNRLRLQGSKEGTISNLWKVGDAAAVQGGDAKTVFFPLAGTYTVTHTTTGIGGMGGATAVQTINVPSNDPFAANIALGGSLDTPEDVAHWTVLNISSPNLVNLSFAGGKATFSGGGNYTQAAIYQAIPVVAGGTYIIDMKVSGTGSNETWLEVYVSPTAPVQNNDYSADGIRIGLNTWTGCATGPFDGWLSAVGCVGTGKTITVPAGVTTLYYVIKCGGNFVNTINIDDIEIRRIN